jgi:hypothetical protein
MKAFVGVRLNIFKAGYYHMESTAMKEMIAFKGVRRNILKASMNHDYVNSGGS